MFSLCKNVFTRKNSAIKYFQNPIFIVTFHTVQTAIQFENITNAILNDIFLQVTNSLIPNTGSKQAAFKQRTANPSANISGIIKKKRE